MNRAEFVAPADIGHAEIEACLAGDFATECAPEFHATCRFHDTFDWRLYRSGWVLEETIRGRRGSFSCYSRDNGTEVTGSAGSKLRRLADLGPVSEELTAVVGLRELLPQVELPVRVHEIKLLNDDRKTVVRCRVERFAAPAGEDGGTVFTAVRLLGLRGYDDELRVAAARVASAIGTSQRECGVLHEAARTLHAVIDGYTAKPQVALPADATILQWLSAICEHLLDVMVNNEAGISRDIDTEFLHDFRVAVRRTRSALGQIRDVFDTDAIAPFRAEFGRLGQITGPLRDLDVFLLHFDELRAAVPGELSSGMDGFHTCLREQRARERRSVVQHLRSPRYRRLVDDWRAFLAAPPAETLGSAANEAASSAARRNTLRVWRRVLKEGRRIADDSPAESLHELRKTCKKLRYLLEFFAPLQHAGDVERLIKRLKRLQENLGDFQDRTVQIEALRSVAGKLAGSEPDTLLSIGALIQRAADRGVAARRDFHHQFRRFDTKSAARLFEELFLPTDGEPA